MLLRANAFRCFNRFLPFRWTSFYFTLFCEETKVERNSENFHSRRYSRLEKSTALLRKITTLAKAFGVEWKQTAVIRARLSENHSESAATKLVVTSIRFRLSVSLQTNKACERHSKTATNTPARLWRLVLNQSHQWPVSFQPANVSGHLDSIRDIRLHLCS